MEFVPITIGGADRNLYFDANAMAAAETELVPAGSSIVSGEIWRRMTVGNLRALLWAALLHEQSTGAAKSARDKAAAQRAALAIETVGSWITIKNHGDVTTAVVLAWKVSGGLTLEEAKEEVKKFEEEYAAQLARIEAGEPLDPPMGTTTSSPAANLPESAG